MKAPAGVGKPILLAVIGSCTLALIVLGLSVGMLGHASDSVAQDPNVNQYSAKFICGNVPSPADEFKPLAPGLYNTEINIHNANDFPVTIQKKVVPEPPPEQLGLPSPRVTLTMAPDSVFQMDCKDILGIWGATGQPCPVPSTGAFPGLNLCKGYAVIEAGSTLPGGGAIVPAQLDVTNVITVKEEDGLWKDYTVVVTCVSGPPCQAMPGIPFGRKLNWADHVVFPPLGPPDPRNCYDEATVAGSSGPACPPLDEDQEIRQGLQKSCLQVTPNNPFCSQITDSTQTAVEIVGERFATDARDVNLEVEFVTTKQVSYSCWPRGTPNCPEPTPSPSQTPTATPTLSRTPRRTPTPTPCPVTVCGTATPTPTPCGTPPCPTPSPTPCTGGACPSPTPVPCDGVPCTPTPTPTPKPTLHAGGSYDFAPNCSSTSTTCCTTASPCTAATVTIVNGTAQAFFDVEFMFANQVPPWTTASGTGLNGWTCNPPSATLLHCSGPAISAGGTLAVANLAIVTTTGAPPCSIEVHATDAGGNNIGVFQILPITKPAGC